MAKVMEMEVPDTCNLQGVPPGFIETFDWRSIQSAYHMVRFNLEDFPSMSHVFKVCFPVEECLFRPWHQEFGAFPFVLSPIELDKSLTLEIEINI